MDNNVFVIKSNVIEYELCKLNLFWVHLYIECGSWNNDMFTCHPLMVFFFTVSDDISYLCCPLQNGLSAPDVTTATECTSMTNTTNNR